MGSFGAVFLAKDLELNRLVAIKVLRQLAEEQEEVRARFRREALILAKLNHPNLVKIYDFEEDTSPPFLVEEYLKGSDLYDKVKKAGPLTPADAGVMISELADGLAHFHGQNIFHRDIKPANIFLDDEGRYRFMDFGLSKHVEDSKLTQEGYIVGTLPYLPPETRQGKAASAAGDIYQIGLTLYYLLKGKHLAKNNAGQWLVERDIPADLRSVILECCEEEVSNRLQNGAALAKYLERELRPGDDSHWSISSTKPVRAQRKERPTNIIATQIQGKGKAKKPMALYLTLAAALALVVALIFFFSMESGRPATVQSVSLASLSQLRVVMGGLPIGEFGIQLKKGNALLQEMKVDFTDAKALSKGQWLNTVDLDYPLLSQHIVEVSKKSEEPTKTTTFILNPKELLEKTLAPIDDLKGELFEQLLREADQRRLSFERKKVSAKEAQTRFLQALAAAGINSQTINEINSLKRAFPRERIFLGSPLAHRLLPLRYIDAVLGNGELLPPWGDLAEAFGATIYASQKVPRVRAGEKRLCHLNLANVKNHVNTSKEYCQYLNLWMGSEKFNQAALKSKVLSTLILLGSDNRTPKARKILTTTTVKVPSFKRPKKIFLDLTLYSFIRPYVVSLTINEKPSVNILNTSLLAGEKAPKKLTNSLCATLELDPDLFKDGFLQQGKSSETNLVKIKIKTIPAQAAVATMAVCKMALRGVY